MNIKGFQGTSLLDFPGRIASLVFYGGCNLTCPFCHNPSLVLGPGELPDYPQEALLADLGQRRSFIDGVVVSGGEPTMAPGLAEFLRKVKGLGLLIKLDTNGLLPQVLESLLEEGLIDYVALDLKTSPHRYGELHTGRVDLSALGDSLRLLLEGRVDYEFRTTCVPGYVEGEDVALMGEAICGARRWVLQQFAPGHALDAGLRDLQPHPAEKIRSFAETAGQWVGDVSVRGL